MEGGGRYTLEVLKVTGIVPETVELLKAWRPGVSAQELARQAVVQDLLGKSSASRVVDVVCQGFAKRYLHPTEEVAARLKTLVERGLDLRLLKQLLLVHTCRTQPLLYDFLVDVYWPKALDGRPELSKPDVHAFVAGSFGSERVPGRWSESIIQRLGRSVLKCLADFGLLGPLKGESRPILSCRIEAFTALYLAHEAHFAGVGDTGILALPDWRCFGLGGPDVVSELRRVSAAHNDLIFQYSGELARFSWKHGSMEEFLNAHAG